jgi:hypothetical protein
MQNGNRIKIGREPAHAVLFFFLSLLVVSPNISIRTHLAAGRTRSARCRPLLELQDVGCSALAVTGGRAAPARSPVTR